MHQKYTSMKEIWKPVQFRRPELTDRFSHLYEISNAGRLRNKEKKIVLSFRNKQTGYQIANMYDDNKKCLQPAIAKLVYFVFTGNIDTPFHKDGIFYNCHLWNLESDLNKEYQIEDNNGLVFENYIEGCQAYETPIAKVRQCCRGLINAVPTKKGNIVFKHTLQEVWATNPNNPTVSVSTSGRVRNDVTEKYVTDMPTMNIAQLVCETFVVEPEPQDGVEYEPKFGAEGDKAVHFHNLRWGRK